MADKSLTWNIRPEDVFAKGFEAYWRDVEAALYALVQSYAPRIEAWMKQNARWTDRTGNARQSLHAEAYDLVPGAAVSFDHGMDYGLWLEVARQGAYQIITPALDHFAPLIWQDIEQLFATS